MKRGAVSQQIGMLLSAFLFIYVAATGPIGAYFEITEGGKEDSPACRVVKVIYLPVIALSDNVPFVESALTRYCEFCEETYRKFQRHPQADPQTVANESPRPAPSE